ncbi:MAG: hypothetical protein ACI87W_003655, partial [Halieaceae bacterium]
ASVRQRNPGVLRRRPWASAARMFSDFESGFG